MNNSINPNVNTELYSRVTYVCGDNPYQIAVNDDGSITIYGDTDEADYLKDISNAVSVTSNFFSAAVVKEDGTVAVSESKQAGSIDTSDWKDIKMVVFESRGLFGLKADGTVLFECYENYELDSVFFGVNKWEDIEYIDASFLAVWGIKKDGRIIFGDPCNSIFAETTLDWNNLKSCSIDIHEAIGLTNNGDVLIPSVDEIEIYFNERKIDDKGNVVKLCYCRGNIIALMSNGSVKVYESIRETNANNVYKVFDGLKGVVDINSYDQYAIALLENGEIVYAGNED